MFLQHQTKTDLHLAWWRDEAGVRDELITLWGRSQLFIIHLYVFSLKSGLCCLALMKISGLNEGPSSEVCVKEHYIRGWQHESVLWYGKGLNKKTAFEELINKKGEKEGKTFIAYGKLFKQMNCCSVMWLSLYPETCNSPSFKLQWLFDIFL